MSDRHEHTGFAVEMRADNRPQILFTGKPAEFHVDERQRGVHPGAMVLPTLESAEALRDALSAFITFHKPRAG